MSAFRSISSSRMHDGVPPPPLELGEAVASYMPTIEENKDEFYFEYDVPNLQIELRKKYFDKSKPLEQRYADIVKENMTLQKDVETLVAVNEMLNKQIEDLRRGILALKGVKA